MRLLRLGGIILIAVCSYLSFSQQQQLEAKPASGLKLTVFFDKDEYKADEPVYINFKLKNSGDKAVYVNKRFYLNSESCEAQEKEVFLQISGPSGEKLPCKVSYDTGFPKTEYFLLLGPEEEIESEGKRNLKAYFDLQASGTYSITATYQNIYGAEIGLDTFKDKVISKPVTIKIVE